MHAAVPTLYPSLQDTRHCTHTCGGVLQGGAPSPSHISHHAFATPLHTRCHRSVWHIISRPSHPTSRADANALSWQELTPVAMAAVTEAGQVSTDPLPTHPTCRLPLSRTTIRLFVW